ncbi:transcription factor E2F6 [Nematolebias whitei]|uniref:transcription factor E2F6 n=1 Tax=Nematolebias whitei TaxID=451745 RepID=UPI001899E304|nr:transcription factor E2F6 [Nematolebias whitei]
MVKCVVTGCPNRDENNPGFFNRTQKRFFRFPTDPARVQVWLAALREPDKHISAEHHRICEDHFLPEDVSTFGVSSDAIPIMPPCLDGPLGLMGPWGAQSEDEEDQWAAGGVNDFEDEGGAGVPFNTKFSVPELPPLDPPLQGSGGLQSPECPLICSEHQFENTIPAKVTPREDVSLGVLTRRFLDLFLKAPSDSLDLRHATTSLRTRRRRLYDITNVLQGIDLIDKQSANRVKWIGTCPVSSFLDQNQIQEEMDNLKMVEETLDFLIQTSDQQLFDMTDDRNNSTLAYVTFEDISRLEAFQEQTLILVKAPEDTRLEIPAPKDSIQVHLKGGTGPVMVMTSDMGTIEPSEQESGCFLKLEESRIDTSEHHRGSQRFIQSV